MGERTNVIFDNEIVQGSGASKGQTCSVGPLMRDVRGLAWWNLTPKQREVLEALSDCRSRRTWRKATSPEAVNALLAARLHDLGMVEYVSCGFCGRGPAVPEVVISNAGLDAVGVRSVSVENGWLGDGWIANEDAASPRGTNHG